MTKTLATRASVTTSVRIQRQLDDVVREVLGDGVDIDLIRWYQCSAIQIKCHVLMPQAHAIPEPRQDESHKSDGSFAEKRDQGCWVFHSGSLCGYS